MRRPGPTSDGRNGGNNAVPRHPRRGVDYYAFWAARTVARAASSRAAVIG